MAHNSDPFPTMSPGSPPPGPRPALSAPPQPPPQPPPSPFAQTSFGGQEAPSVMDTPQVQCVVRPVVAGVMGYPMALAFAFLFPGHDINNMPGIGPDAKTRTKVLHSFKLSARSGMENGRTFAKMGVIWSGAECVLEVGRARSDMWNGVAAGCFTGAVLAIGAGPVAMAGGCGGLAGFAAVMDLAFQGGKHKS